jgi:hypothetical protein
VLRWRTIAGVGLALVLCAPTAAAASGDASSSHVFLTATARFLHTTIARRHQEAAAVDALIAHVDSDCPDAVPVSLQKGTTAQQNTAMLFQLALDGELAVAEIGPLRSAYASFDRAIAHLQWSDHDLHRRIALAVKQARATAAIRAPDLCGQASLAAESNFTAAPPAIRTFVRRLDQANSSESTTTGQLIALVARFAGPGDAGLIKRVDQLQKRTEAIIKRLSLRGLVTLTRAFSG